MSVKLQSIYKLNFILKYSIRLGDAILGDSVTTGDDFFTGHL